MRDPSPNFIAMLLALVAVVAIIMFGGCSQAPSCPALPLQHNAAPSICAGAPAGVFKTSTGEVVFPTCTVGSWRPDADGGGPGLVEVFCP